MEIALSTSISNLKKFSCTSGLYPHPWRGRGLWGDPNPGTLTTNFFFAPSGRRKSKHLDFTINLNTLNKTRFKKMKTCTCVTTLINLVGNFRKAMRNKVLCLMSPRCVVLYQKFKKTNKLYLLYKILRIIFLSLTCTCVAKSKNTFGKHNHTISTYGYFRISTETWHHVYARRILSWLSDSLWFSRWFRGQNFCYNLMHDGDLKHGLYLSYGLNNNWGVHKN